MEKITNDMIAKAGERIDDEYFFNIVTQELKNNLKNDGS